MSKMLKGAKKAIFNADINNLETTSSNDELTESFNEIVNELKQNLKRCKWREKAKGNNSKTYDRWSYNL